MRGPTFTVVMPTRADAPYLRAAVASVLTSEEDMEVLLVQDRTLGRPPLHVDGIRDPRVRVLDSWQPSAAAARNVGIEAARGRFIAFLDDDDLWLPGHLSEAREALEADHGAILYAADVYIFYDPTPDGSAVPPADVSTLGRLAPGWTGPALSTAELLLESQLPSTTVVLARERLSADERFRSECAPGEDYDLWLRLADRQRLLWSPRPSGIVRRRFGSVSSRYRRRQGEVLLELLEPRLRRTLPPGLTRKEARRRLARVWQSMAGIDLLSDHAASGRRAALKSIGRWPFAPRPYVILAASLAPGFLRRAGLAVLRGTARRLLARGAPAMARTYLYTLATVGGGPAAPPAAVVSGSAATEQADQAPTDPSSQLDRELARGHMIE